MDLHTHFRRIAALGIALVAFLLSACGGGAEGDGAALRSAQKVDERRVQALQVTTTAIAGDALVLTNVAIQSLVLVRETRVSRTVFDYEFQVVARNSGTPVNDVTIVLTQVGTGSQIVRSTVSYASLATDEAAIARDTVLIRHDRSRPFDKSSLVWEIRGTFTLPSAIIDIDAAVPASAVAQVAELVSAAAVGRPGVRMPIDTASNDGGSTVFALDQNGDIVLAGSAKRGSRVALNASSTALELVRLALPAIPGLTSRDDTDRFVSANSRFNALVASVDGAHAAGHSIVDNATVQRALEQVVRAVANGPGAATTTLRTDARKRTNAIATDRPSGPPPLSIIRTGGRSIHVVNEGSLLNLLGSRPVLQNATPLYWSASVADADGRAIGDADFPTGRTLVNPATLFQLLSNPLQDLLPVDVPYIGLTRQGLPDTKARSFTLTVEQDGASVAANLGHLVIELFKMTTDLEPSGTCAEAFAKAVIKPSDIAAFVAGPSLRSLSTLLQAVAANSLFATVTPTFLLPTTVQATCLKAPNATFAPVIGRFLRAKLKWLAAQVKLASIAIDILSVVDKATLFVVNNEVPAKQRTLGICLDKDGWIRNCAKTFKADPENLVIAPGAIVRDWKVKAFDTSDPPKETGLPISLTAAMSNTAVANVSGAGVINVEGLTPGDSKLELSDAATGATGSANVYVRVPQLSTQSLTLKVDQTATVDFVDGNGRKIDRNAVHELILFDPAIIEVPVTKSDSTSFALKARAPGSTDLVAYNVAYGNSLKLRVNVLASGPQIFSGPALLTGTAVFGSFPCSGTSRIEGTLTLTTDADGGRVRIVATSHDRTSCYSADAPLDWSWRLTRTATGYSGSISTDYTCASPCVGGTSTWHIDLGFVGEGPGAYLAGTLRHVNAAYGLMGTYTVTASGQVEMKPQ